MIAIIIKAKAPELGSAMTKLIKLLVSVLGDVTSVCMHKTIVCRYDINSTYIKYIVCKYDVRETEQARISCVLIANQNRAGDTNV